MVLPLIGAGDEDIEIIDGMVMATMIPQNPRTHLEQIMCDADLSLMGLPTWFNVIDSYRKELGVSNIRQWYEAQIKFLSSHNWFTDSAKKLYDDTKQRNLQVVSGELEALKHKATMSR